MSKQTSVEWVIQHFSPLINLQQNQIDGIEERAKEMEKQQQSRAWYDGLENWDSEKSFEQYYNETFNK